MLNVESQKFLDPKKTAKGEERASVELKDLKTLWFNTGTQCNLSCENCYIESNPQNDRLVYISEKDVIPYLDEIKELGLGTREIGFTGGEPFLNSNIIEILEACLSRGFKTIVLTNAYRMINRYKDEVVRLSLKYKELFLVRVSLDHYSEKIHEQERGLGTFQATLKMLTWLSEKGVSIAVAGRSLTGESHESSKKSYADLLAKHNVSIDCDDPEKFVVFAEMNMEKDVPEITTACWGILGRDPDEMMCSSSRMIVKRKGDVGTKVLACTLLAYDAQFELGETLKSSPKSVRLNHPFCAQFCVLGGSSCS